QGRAHRRLAPAAQRARRAAAVEEAQRPRPPQHLRAGPARFLPGARSAHPRQRQAGSEEVQGAGGGVGAGMMCYDAAWIMPQPEGSAMSIAAEAAPLGPLSAGILMTPAEFDAIEDYDKNYRYELIHGVLVVSPIPLPEETGPNELLGVLLFLYQTGHPEGAHL